MLNKDSENYLSKNLQRMVKIFLIFFFSSFFLFFNTGCAGFGKKMKAFMSGKPVPAKGAKKKVKKGPGITYSKVQNYGYRNNRNYKRTTKSKLERESRLNSEAGSLWVTEGQGSYLFAQNILRQPGDILNIYLNGAPRKQLETKVKIIKRLLRRLSRPKKKSRGLAGILLNPGQTKKAKPGKRSTKTAKGKKKGKRKGKKKGKLAAEPPPPPPPPTPKAAEAEKPREKIDGSFDVEFVPTRIVDRLMDGNYRVKGNQTFMIGKREYKVIVTGIIRADDFNDEGVSAGRLLDPQFDIVSMKRKEKL